MTELCPNVRPGGSVIPVATIQLKYGGAALPLTYDEDRLTPLVPLPPPAFAEPLTDLDVHAALDSPIDSPPLEGIVSPNESVLIVVSDATRATASEQIVNVLVRRLVELTVSPADINVIFATGIHRRVTPAERSRLLTPFITQRIRTLDHDPQDEAQLVNLGTTENGTPIEVNRALEDYSHVILTGAINFHYFAGFTGGRKSICPGLASARTVEATHRLAFDFERGGRRRGVGAGRLDGNVVHEECERIAAEIAPSFLVNTVVDERGLATRVYAGDWRAAHRYGCAEYASEHAIEIDEKRPLVIASCGGRPKDINLIQAHKTLDAASYACADGGTIIVVAECADGLGRADFLKWFKPGGDAASLERELRDRYEVNGQTAWALLTKTERHRVVLVSDLPPEDVRRMNMWPADSLDEALKQVDARASGYVMPYGDAYLPTLRPAAPSNFVQ